MHIPGTATAEEDRARTHRPQRGTVAVDRDPRNRQGWSEVRGYSQTQVVGHGLSSIASPQNFGDDRGRARHGQTAACSNVPIAAVPRLCLLDGRGHYIHIQIYLCMYTERERERKYLTYFTRMYVCIQRESERKCLLHISHTGRS